GISGFTQFAHDDAPKGSALREELAEVLTLAKRAADLTHQLLAFSRRQPLQPVVLNVNDVVRESMKMLQRLLGEHLLLEVNLAAELDMVKVDPGQFEQVLVNLAVNARDAMQAGGQLTIETANVVLDEVYAASHLGTQPGAYVMLAVSDSGTGIDAAVIERIFEPFFSTKGVGKGTGLGLSTVYGIVKQHGGNIWVYSEPGMGTTFKVYLPRVLEDVTRDVVFVPTPSSGIETILLVEDSDAVLRVTLRNLETLGYTVFTATRPSEADAVLQAHGDAIDLLLTDVVMPEQNGRQLYEAALARFPRLRVLYMSGYTSDAIVHDGVLDPDTPFMEKPFTIDTLARKVREALMGGSDVC
ncbi:MAG: ATP-binding protein, partial [bacterium]